MFGIFSALKNLIFTSHDENEINEEDLWDKLDEQSDEFLEKVHIEQLCSNVPELEEELDDEEFNVGDKKEGVVKYSEIKEGVITTVKKDGGVINHVYLCRSEDILPHIIQAGDQVLFRTIIQAGVEEVLFVKVEKITPKHSTKSLDVIEPSKLIGQTFELDRKVTGKITDKCTNSLTVDNHHTLPLNNVKCDFILEIGDKVSIDCAADIKTGEIIEYKHVKPATRKLFTHCAITHYNESMGIGVVLHEVKNAKNIEVAFSKNVCKQGYLPALNDLVCVDAMESDQELFQWRALNLDLEKRVEQAKTAVAPSLRSFVATHEELTAKCISENRFNMEGGRNEYITIEIRNTGFKPRQLLAVNIDNQERNGGHLISQLRTVRPSHDKYVKFPACILPGKYLEFVMEVMPRFLGKSSEKLTFSLDNEGALKVPVELEIYIKGLSEKQNGVKRFQRKKQYNAEEICFRDSLLNIIRGVRPTSNGMKFQSVRLPAYEVPHRLLESCRGGTRGQQVPTQSQMVENLKLYYGVLYEQLSEDNYMSKFHTCLFLEEITLMAHMANLEIAKGVLRHSGEYLALYVVGLMEARPSLIIGDRVYASVPDNVNIKDKANTYEGFIHAIRHEELLIKFAKTFHDSYRGESYRFRFVHGRTQFRRLHYVLDDVMKPKLGVEWLFPRLVQEKAPVVDIIGEDQPIEKPVYLNEKPELLTKKLKKIFPSSQENEQGDQTVVKTGDNPDIKPDRSDCHDRKEKEEIVPIGKNEEQIEVTRDSRNTTSPSNLHVSNESTSVLSDQNTVPITTNQSISQNRGNKNDSPIATNQNTSPITSNEITPSIRDKTELQEFENIAPTSSSATAEELALFNKLLNPTRQGGRQKVSFPRNGVAVKPINGVLDQSTGRDEVNKQKEQSIVDGVSDGVGDKLVQKLTSIGTEVSADILDGKRENKIVHTGNDRDKFSKTTDVVIPNTNNEERVPMEVQVAGNILQDKTNVEESQSKPTKPTKEPTEMEKLNWGKTKRNSEVQWVRDFAGMGGAPRTNNPNARLTNIPLRQKELIWFNRNLNWYQKAAVRNILKFEARPLPYIIFGPPGTGKTVTVTETVLQLYNLIPESRILLATPNNASADLLTENLIESGQFQIGDLVRLLSFTYLQNGNVPANIAPYCSLVNNKHLDDCRETVENTGGVTVQSRESLLQHRLLISTCSSFGQLITLGVPAGYFTHCIVDEAGQATEPEILVPISLLHKDNGHVVLAGDPLQLGPAVFSKMGQQLELATSLLERLTSRYLYARDVTRFYETGGYDPRLVTRLVDNYRTMPEILKISSDLFYDSSLVPHVSLEDYEGLILSKLGKVLPPRPAHSTHPSPILFHGVQGDAAQDKESPSWYNSTEAVVVIAYLKKLYDAGLHSDQIGIITPYRRQVAKIRYIISGCGIPEPKVASIEEFQGQERLVIIVSTVRSLSSSASLPQDLSQCLGFIGLPTRLNVAMTRARALLILVGDPNLLAEDVYWCKIINYVKSIGGYTGCIPNHPKLGM
uniref:RNA helicase n=1 Tax=Cacopsylla melanoneura TaxID=428564 RepID=A0A8D8SWQ4_9HEMI